MKKIFATLLCMMFCSCMTDYSATSVLEYKNESSRDIQLIGPVYNKDSQKVADVKYSLPAGGVEVVELFSTPYFISKDNKDKDHFDPTSVWNDNGIRNVCFDNSIVVPIEQFGGYDKSSYEYIKKNRYRYTFTDADYQFALENGTKLEY